MDVTVLVGNPKPQSRTLGVAASVADHIERRLATTGERSRTTIDLADLGPALLDWGDERVAGLVVGVVASDLLVVASPTYKASFTGLLKLFLDRIPAPDLRPVVAVPVMVGGAPIHYLAPEVHLRPVLVELGASCPTGALFVLESQLDDLDAVIGEWLDGAESSLRRALA